MRTTASGTRAPAPTSPTLTPELLSDVTKALQSAEGCTAAALWIAQHHPRLDDLLILVEGIERHAALARAALAKVEGGAS
ncbi:MAG: hypothetical protein JNL37_13770 [Thauera sp.]|nr:hypothetical protein [Thauera sp.]